MHRPHLGLDGGLGDVARVGADGSRTVCTIASPAKTDTEGSQLKILVPPLPSKLKFSNPAKKASMHWLTYEMLSHSGAAKRRWSGGAPRRGTSAWPAWRRGGAGRRNSGPAWRRGGAGHRAEAAGRRGVGADALTMVSNKLPCQNQDKVLSLQVYKPCQKKHALN